MIERLMFLSIPGLRPIDIHDPAVAPTLAGLAQRGASAKLTPSFPCVTSPVQAAMLTGAPPSQHGVIANGFYHPDRREVEFWVAHHSIIEKPTFFSLLNQQRPDKSSAVWHAQNIKGAAANYIVTPSPIHEADGTMKLWCYSKPDGLYQDMLGELGHFPLQHYWGPLSNIQSTKWIIEGALWLARRHAPHFQYVYLPHLDYAAQKFGPNSPQALAAVRELDAAIKEFIDRYNALPNTENTAWVLAGEYALTDVTGACHPNRLLRNAGLLRVKEPRASARADSQACELLDIEASDAFAMVDHQFAHVFMHRGDPEKVSEVFRGNTDVADILVGKERAALGMDHARAAPIILISRPDRWFSYYWWLDDAAAPPFARTVDIHAKPGYDPLELFIKMPERQIPLDASLVRGSHGAPAVSPQQQSVVISSHADLLADIDSPMTDRHVFQILCRAFGVNPN